MQVMETINWDAERERFERVAYPFALRAAKRAFKRWHERKRDDAEAEFMAKMWDQWSRLILKGKDPEPLLWPLIHWSRQWVRYDRRLAGRPHNIDIQDYRAEMVQHLMDCRGRLKPHERSARINGFLDWTGQARTDDPSELIAALESAGMSLEEYLAA
jgi:hypothetical protein